MEILQFLTLFSWIYFVHFVFNSLYILSLVYIKLYITIIHDGFASIDVCAGTDTIHIIRHTTQHSTNINIVYSVFPLTLN